MQTKEQPMIQQLAVVDETLEQILPPHMKPRCEICLCEVSPQTYDENLGVCDPCNRRLE